MKLASLFYVHHFVLPKCVRSKLKLNISDDLYKLKSIPTGVLNLTILTSASSLNKNKAALMRFQYL